MDIEIDELLKQKKLILEAFDIVLEMVGYFHDYNDPAPQGTVNFLWNKKFKLEDMLEQQ
jgi:hypothetical protein